MYVQYNVCASRKITRDRDDWGHIILDDIDYKNPWQILDRPTHGQ